MAFRESEHVYFFNAHPLFAYTDSWHQAGAQDTVEYHGCRLLRDFPMPRNPSDLCRHNETYCRRGNELNLIESDANGNLLGFDDANQLQLDLRKEDLENIFPLAPTIA